MKIVTRTRKEVYKMWIKALRSGKYKQGRDVLNKSSEFCCLGVVCDLANKDGGPQWIKYLGDGYGRSFMGQSGILPDPVREFLGLTEMAQNYLASLNDNGISFKQIADYIETTIMPTACK
jgi:hypothetical protein